MSDLLREVDEAMRQERMEKFWKENKSTLILCVIATIVMTGVVSAYRAWDHNVKAADTSTVLALMEDPTFPDNIKDKKIDARPAMRGIALVNGGQKYLAANKPDEALALYTKAADDGAIPDEIRHLAILMEARLNKNAGSDDKLMKNLNSVTKDNGSPWQNHARIEAAAITAAKGDYKTARAYLADAMDQKALPETLYSKASALDHVYALKEKTPGAAPTPKEGS